MDSQADRNYDDAFDRLTSKQGGRLELSTLPHEIQSIYQHFLDYAQHWIDTRRHTKQTSPSNMPYVHFGFTAGTTINAIAIRDLDNEQDYIGVNAGTLHILIDTFHRMMAHPKVFDWVGNPTLENNPKYNLPYLFTNVWEIPYSVIQMEIAKDPVRRKYAHKLIRHAMNFLIAHELAHHRYGHILLTTQKANCSAISEVYFHERMPLDSLSMQALEMDADAWATVCGVGQIMHELDEHDADPELKTWYVAVYTLFRIFSEYGDGLSGSSGSHPPPRLRQIMIAGTIYELLLRDTNQNFADKQRHETSNAIFDVENAVEHLTGKKIKLDGILEASDERGQEYVAKILKQWDHVVEPQLVPLTRATDLCV